MINCSNAKIKWLTIMLASGTSKSYSLTSDFKVQWFTKFLRAKVKTSEEKLFLKRFISFYTCIWSVYLLSTICQINFWNTNAFIFNNVAGFVSMAVLLLGTVINTTSFYLAGVEKALYWKVLFSPVAKVLKFYHLRLILLDRAVPFLVIFLQWKYASQANTSAH